MQSLFITGVGGFIGLRLAERALERGVRVSGVDLSPAAAEKARALGVEAATGDVTDPARMQELIRGADTVIHTAALVRESGELALFRHVNVQGTLNVARAARAAGARTFVQLSSVMVYGFDFQDGVAEDGPLDGANNPYCQTKIESERAVLALNAPAEFGVIIIRPGDVYGPGSIPWIARPIELLRSRQFVMPMGGRGVINHVYVDNLVDGIYLAIERSAYGEAFNISDGVATSCREFFGRVAELAAVPRPRSLPTPMLRLIGRAAEQLKARGLIQMDANTESIRYLMRRHRYSIDKAQRVLGYAPRVSLDEGLRRSADYIRAQAHADSAVTGHRRA